MYLRARLWKRISISKPIDTCIDQYVFQKRWFDSRSKKKKEKKIARNLRFQKR